MKNAKNILRKTDLLQAYTIEYEESFKKACDSGFGCGYVKIQKDHPMYKQACLLNDDHYYNHQLTDFSEEITLTNFNFQENTLLIGFDLAHSWNDKTHDKQFCEEKTLQMFDLIDSYKMSDFENDKLNEIKRVLDKINSI